MSKGLIIAITGTVVGAFFIATGIYAKKYKKSLWGVIFIALGSILGIVTGQKNRIKKQQEEIQVQRTELENAKKQMQEVKNVQNKLKEIRQEKPQVEKEVMPDVSDGPAIAARLNKLSNPETNEQR